MKRLYSPTSLLERCRSTKARACCNAKRCRSTLAKPLVVSEEVAAAVQGHRPVVALETTIYTHGFPYPDNIALSTNLESLIRKHGAIPATIGVLDGTAKVGMQPEEIIQLLEKAGDPMTVKVSRRDLGFVCGTKGYHGGTTIAGTLVLAHLAGIKIFATGGLGGVHRDQPGQTSMDVSADLTELGRTPMALISSGCKSFLDISRTLEYLETEGVGVGTFADGREGEVMFPAFWTRESSFPSPNVIKDETEAAQIIYSQLSLPLTSGLLFANPIPVESSLPNDMIDQITDQVVAEAAEKGISGKANTPYILSRIRELSNNGTTRANRALVEANVVRGAKVAVELARLESAPKSIYQFSVDAAYTSGAGPVRADVLVAGSIAIDFSCNYEPLVKSQDLSRSPTLQTSNPARIFQTLGGVGQNVAIACHYMGVKTTLCSIIGKDSAGKIALSMLKEKGMDTSTILKSNYCSRTAQYVAINDEKSDLMVAMADMKVLEADIGAFADTWYPIVIQNQPKWLVVDANWNHNTLHEWISAGRKVGAKIAYEPVSVEKSARLFDRLELLTGSAPQLVDLVTPNSIELQAMLDAIVPGQITASTQFEDSSRLRDLVQKHLAQARYPFDLDVAFNAIRLLPLIPCILAKQGPKGVLQVEQLEVGDHRLRETQSKQYVLDLGFGLSSRAEKSASAIYIRHHPPATVLELGEIESVNGVGDTFLGVVLAALLKGGSRNFEDAIPLAQKASLETLRSTESVSPTIRSMASM